MKLIHEQSEICLILQKFVENILDPEKGESGQKEFNWNAIDHSQDHLYSNLMSAPWYDEIADFYYKSLEDD